MKLRGLIAACLLVVLCGTPLASAAFGDPVTAEATGPGGAAVTFDEGGFTCTPSSGSAFPLGDTTVSCVDGGGAPAGSFTVTVVDTTAPSLSTPGDVNASSTTGGAVPVSYTEPSANDIVDGALTPTCSAHSGDTFPVGTTTVNCSVSDAHSNPASASFNVTVTVVDTTNPVLSGVPADISETTTAPGGKVINYTKPTATDNIDGPVPVTCTPDTGATFPIGQTTVTCSATDASGNTDSASFNVTITFVDTIAPTFSNVPSDITDSTTVPAGKVVSFTKPTATDNVDGVMPASAVSCSPASGSTFPIGETTVTCSATDASGNTGSVPFKVTIAFIDLAPTFSNVPQDIFVEANGPGGSLANFTVPTALDDHDGLLANVSCSPGPGSTFPLGDTTVTCSATDSGGNTGQASFKVTVRDTTPPSLVVPQPHGVYATSPLGISDSDPAIIAFVGAASATDIVDPHPVVGSDLQSFLPLGVTAIRFFGRDFSGNSTTREVLLTVLPQPPAGTPPLQPPQVARPPANVANLSITSLDRALRLTWQAPAGVDHVVVTRSTSAGGAGQVVHSGKANSYTDRGLENGVEYRYVVASVDAVGNRSAGVAILGVPLRNMLRSPKDGARLKKPPKLVWAAEAEADYYNAQLLRNGVRILSVWPRKTNFTLKKTWKLRGQTYRLTPGVYQWFVWPGFGPRTAVNYGQLLGSRTFRIVR